MATALEAGEPWLANAVIHRLSEEKVDAADHLIRSANALGDLAFFEQYHDVSLADVTASIDGLQPECPHAVLAAAWFAEHAIAQGQPDLVRQRAAVLRAARQGSGLSATNSVRERTLGHLSNQNHSRRAASGPEAVPAPRSGFGELVSRT
ncbi:MULTISPECIES: hypothetical protein [unclassified Streptomyces]|uniref:hypothetical protein n=1 Tax=unclassified Streptomyces TaxID=2593676 RepID=UPI00114CDFAD|nr:MULTISPECIES: hypothetical protein [unclassified Streptomyces]MYR66338.1 hypothetical protein [Streptomyces sp. SID4939]MYS01449.1 hypothetical protein [Streptomyces sp. SID4940]MYT64446.1 hypothetical protein [Streptomyces sp. SID8357]MYT87259.1 hypothetical protein [Streptomyces sp. SID8360]MYW37178.1 hypothetical protein [Streptomyces sp. SID1]